MVTISAVASSVPVAFYGLFILSFVQVQNLVFAQDITQTTSATVKTDNTTSAVSAGLSAADIAGITVGAFFLVIIIAVHTLCCRCNPRRWVHAKSYLMNPLSSYGASIDRGDSLRVKDDMELGNGTELDKNDDVPPSYESASGTDTLEFRDTILGRSNIAIGDQADVAIPIPPQSNPSVVYAKVNKQKSPSPEDDNANPGQKPKKLLRFDINRRGKMDKLDSADAKQPQSIQPVDKKQSPNPEDNEKDPKSCKKIKRFAINRRGKVDKASSSPEPEEHTAKMRMPFGIFRRGKMAKPPKTEAVIVYAELDLPEVDKDIPPLPPKEARTVYAQIKR